MSKPKPEKNHELAEVLARINALTQHSEQIPNQATLENTAAEIPLLTKIYEGDPITFSTRAILEPATSGAAIIDQPDMKNERTASLQADETLPAAETQLIEKLLVEMRPEIQAVVRGAVQLELAQLEQLLYMRLEADLMRRLREQLQTGAS